MKQSIKATSRQQALWSERRDRIQPPEEIHEEVIGVLADLLLEAMGVKAPANQTGGDDESEDLA